jgi:lipid II:glycine glycyltransferase (peptidoglycan interpeptide bridge formation enzyme)
MTLGIRRAGPGDRADWSAFVASRPEGDVLQSWAWGEAGANEPGERWERLMVVDAAGRTRGVAQVLARATTFGRTILYVPHGPLWDREAPDAAEVLAHLLTGLRSHARQRRGVVLKLDPRATTVRGADTAAGQAASAASAASVASAAAVEQVLLAGGARPARHDLQAPTTRIVDLASDVDPVAGWSRDARAELRRAEREGTTTWLDLAGLPAALDAFHALLAETSERAGFRIRSRAFLGTLAAALAVSGDWFLANAEHDGRPLAGCVAARTGERAFYLYAASSRDPELAVKRGPYAAMAALQRGLAEAGTRSLDLWGVREPDDPGVDASWEGFSLFKRRFGGQPLRHPGTFDLVVDPAWNRLRDLRERLRSGHG